LGESQSRKKIILSRGNVRIGNGSTEPYLNVAQSYFCDRVSKSGSTEPSFGIHLDLEFPPSQKFLHGDFFSAYLMSRFEFQNLLSRGTLDTIKNMWRGFFPLKMFPVSIPSRIRIPF
jgi:hypothetical protein